MLSYANKKTLSDHGPQTAMVYYIIDETMDVLLYKRVFVPTYTKPHNKWMFGYNTEKQVPFMHDR